MADQDLRIKVSAETGAAQDAIGKLSDEMAGLTKATGGAGTEQQRLAKQTAEAAQKVEATRQAVERAKRAQQEASVVAQAFGKESREAAEAQGRLKAAEEAATKAARESERALAETAHAVTEAAKAADDKARPALLRMGETLQRAGQVADKTASELRILETRMSTTGTQARSLGIALGTFAGSMAANAVTGMASRVGDLGLHALDTAANFERMKTALATTLGGTEAAAVAFADLQKFAAATPFSLEEVTQGFLKLKARGLDAGEKALTSYGNTASAMGKTMDDMVEAVADAVNGEGERLKEFGVGLKVAGDKASITFRGMTTTVAREAKAIEAELIRLGEVNFAGGMEAQSRTLGGLWSTMKDGFDQFIVGIMDSGVSTALKDLMGTFSGMGETGKLLSDILGVALGGAFTVISGTVKAAAAAVELLALGLNTLLSPIGMVVDAAKPLVDDTFNAITIKAREAAAAQAELAASIGPVQRGTGDMVDIMLTGQEAAFGYTGALWDQARAYMEVEASAKKAGDRQAELWKKLEDANAKAEAKAEEDAFMVANAMGPALPAGFDRDKKKKGGKAKEEKAARISDAGLMNVSRAFVDPMQEAERAIAAYEAESAARDKALAGIEREVAALEARGIAERETVDMVFYQVEIESEAQRQRDALIDQRIDGELRLARWQSRNAKTEEQREKARTRLDAAEHAKRLHVLERAAAEEAKTARQRERVFGTLAHAHNTLAETMVDAAFAAANGEKVAVGAMLQELLKGVAKKHTILALGEAALAVGAAASYRYAAAAQHGASAGMHGAVAAAAGLGAFALGKVVDIPQKGSGDGGGRESSGSSKRDTGAGAGRGGGDGLDQQEVPLTHEQLRRGDPSMRRGADGGGVTINLQVGSIVGAGGVREVADMIRREFDRQDRGGKRARL